MDSAYNILQNYTCSFSYQPPKKEALINFHPNISHPVLHRFACFLPPFCRLISPLYSQKIGNAKDIPVKPYKHIKNTQFRTVKPLEAQPVVKSPQFCTQIGQRHLPDIYKIYRKSSEEVNFPTWSGTERL